MSGYHKGKFDADQYWGYNSLFHRLQQMRKILMLIHIVV